MAQPSWTDYVTAIATAATALFAGLSGIAALIVLRRESRRLLPVIEPDFRWADEKDVGPHIRTLILITNRLDETLVIDSVKLARPAGGTLSPGCPTGYGGDTKAGRGHSPRLSLGRQIRPRGEPDSIGRDSSGDWAQLMLYAFPPPQWSAGKVRLEIRISSKALTIRNRRIVIQRTVPAMAASVRWASAHRRKPPPECG